MSAAVSALVEHFETILARHMQGMPIVNPALSVEAVGFREHGDHDVGVLITPWFMNLVLLPGADTWSDLEPGAAVACALPAGRYDFTLSRDDRIGTYLTAVLFRTVVDFPDQETAREIAREVLRKLFAKPAEGQAAATSSAETFSRRTLFTMLGGR